MKSGPSSLRFWLIVFVLAAVVLLTLFVGESQLYDSDSYYHLAIARSMAESGIGDDLPWARFSLLRDGFGDKEFLFHALLVPFVALFEPVTGGQIFLSLLLAALFATLALHTRAFLGNWAVLVPFALCVTSTEVVWRWVRLRPESLSLLLLLWALWALARRRWVLLGALGATYALSYTAFHAFGGLCLLIFVATWWLRGRFEPAMVASPAIGIGVGLLIHPHFPHNVEVWTVQTFEFFRQKGILDVGTEIYPNTSDVLLMVNIGWLVALLVLARSAEPVGPRAEPGELAEREADAYAVAALAFSVLYLLMARFSLYAIPLITIWLTKELVRRGRRLGGSTFLPGGNVRVPLFAALGLSLLISTPEATRQWQRYAERMDPGPNNERIVDREAFSAALPDGATVAAPWQQTPIYMLWAPQARSLNVLDPIFMAVQDPERHELQRRVFAGLEADLPLAVALGLESRYLAVSAFVDHDRMRRRIGDDPRFSKRHENVNRLWEILPGRNDSFLLDWYLLPDDAAPASSTSDRSGWIPYPRHPTSIGRQLEGLIDLRRFEGGDRCRLLAHPLTAEGEARWWLELTPAGPGSAWLEAEPKVVMAGGIDAILGRGTVFPVDLVGGESLLTVRTCPQAATGANGFFISRVSPPHQESR
ncbi:MAG: hypothetical protein VYE73_06185 [Acidobacteriota bacterium]|nr:hypothetical protein [Acidobacteriota bacterium]